MRILSRYILREYLIPLCYTLGGFVAIYVLFELFGSFGRLSESGLDFVNIVKYFAAYLAPYFHYIAPAALMLAALYTMWSFCRHSELIAMRANGISFIAIAAPILFVACVMTGFVYYVNECYVPEHAQWANQLKTMRFDLNKLAERDNIIFRNATECRTWMVDGLADSDGYVLKGVKVAIDRPMGGARKMTIVADKAEYLDGEWWFTNPKVQHYDVSGSEIATPTPELDAMKFRTFDGISERPMDFILQNRPWQYNSTAARIHMLNTRKDISPTQRDGYLYDTLSMLLSPIACILITLIAIPAGIATGRQSVFKGVLGALGLYFAYYGMIIAGMVFANLGWLWPAPAAILPHVVFLGIGIRTFWIHR